MMGKIRYFERKEIDTVKWNNCIDNAFNSLLYAKSYYLDVMAKNWSAIILNDYEAVMPLAYNIKFSIRYVYMPPFVQQLGIFSTDKVSKDILDRMVAVAHQKFKFGEYNFNYQNEHISFTQKNNFILRLSQEHGYLKKKYKTVLKKNLAIANKKGLHYSTSMDARLAISTFQSLYKERVTINRSDYVMLEMLSSVLLEKNQTLIREVRNKTGNLLSIALFLKDVKRIYFLLSATTLEGRKINANHYLLDQLILEFALQDILFDFEGSDIDGIALFYKAFGSENQPYYFHRWNNLPWPLSWLKG